MLVLEAAERFDLLLDHIVVKLASEIEVLNGNTFTGQLIQTHVHFAEAAAPKKLLRFEGIDTHIIIKVVAHGVEH